MKRKGSKTALCGLTAALSLIFLWFACLVPSGKLGLCAVAGVFPACAVLTGGVSYGFFSWAASGLLGLLLLPDKFTALLYLAALGLYPVLKSVLEQLPNRGAEWLLKFLYFNTVLTLFWIFARTALLGAIPEVLSRTGLLYAAGNAVFLIYDLALSQLLTQIGKRLKKGLHKSR